MKLKVKGMHCDACKALVRMELEENGFEENIVSVEVVEDQLGQVELVDVTDEDQKKIIKIINSMDSYQVLE